MGEGQIGISYEEDLISAFGSSNLQTAVVGTYNGIVSNPQLYYRTIVNPSFTNVDGHLTGTFLMTFSGGKNETDPITGVQHYWITFVGNHGYSFGFISTPEPFLSPENTEVHNQLIYSIKFLGGNDRMTGNTTN